MRSTVHNRPQFFRRMKKKPALQAIIDNILSYTEEQLSEITGQPLWIREELVRMRRNNGQYLMTPEEIVDAMQGSTPVLEEQTGEVLEWIAETGWLGADNGRQKFETEIDTGDLLFLVANDRCYSGDMIIMLDAANHSKLVASAVSKGRMTRSDYDADHQEHLLKKHGLSA